MSPRRLSSSLVLSDGQEGVAGQAGTITTIEPDGTFQVAPFVGRQVEPPARSGRLSPEGMRALATALAQDLTPELPASLGGPATTNPRRLRLTYGATSTTLFLPPGADLRYRR